MVTQKEVIDYLTSAAPVAIPIILSYQAQIMGYLPQDNAILIMAASLFFGALSQYAARVRRNAAVDAKESECLAAIPEEPPADEAA